MDEGDVRTSRSLSAVLAELRLRKGMTKQALAEASDVSATYIGQIESGTDPRSGKEYQPSPPKLRMLADALGRGSGEEAEGIYRLLMEAAGYLPDQLLPEWLKAPPPPARRGEAAQSRAGDGSGRLVERSAPYQQPSPDVPSVGVALERPAPEQTADPRLESRLRTLVRYWDELTTGEQGAVLEFLEFIEHKRRRRAGTRES